MRKQELNLAAAFAATFVFGLTFYTAGCGSSSHPQTAPAAAAPEDNPIAQMTAPPQKKAGAELWAENCTRCHNGRPPQYYSDVQWDIVVHHMRLRANLTGEDARSIAEFLKAAN